MPPFCAIQSKAMRCNKAMNRIHLVLLCLLLHSLTALGQNTLSWNDPCAATTIVGNGMLKQFREGKLSLDDLRQEVVRTSELIFEGEVVNDEPLYHAVEEYPGTGDTSLGFRHYLLKVKHVFKGDLKPNTLVELICKRTTRVLVNTIVEALLTAT